jgi:hypothetical protein
MWTSYLKYLSARPEENVAAVRGVDGRTAGSGPLPEKARPKNLSKEP